MTQPAMTIDEWLKYGQEKGFCSTPVCDTHDGLPSTGDEDERWEAGEYPCVPAVRLYEQ